MKFPYPLVGLALSILSLSISAEPVGVDPDRLEKMIEQEGALVIDIRTPQEWKATGTIPSSRKMMFFDESGEAHEQEWLAELNRARKPDQPVILVCRSGGRSSKVGDFLDQSLGMKNVYHLENGITEWIEQGKAVKPCDEQSC
jgi:rhodanese-related sulfurtransferase